MLLYLLLFISEILFINLIRELYYSRNRTKFIIASVLNLTLSAWFWIIIFKSISFNGLYDEPANISRQMTINGMIAGIIFPRIVILIFHYTGRLFRIRKKGHSKPATITGTIIAGIIVLIIASGSFIGRYNYKVERINIEIPGLNPLLEGTRIVHISDIHLASFYLKYKHLEQINDTINSLNADIIFNTGDFVSYGWREFGSADTVLINAKARYGMFAISGNHDMGTYLPVANDSVRRSVLANVNRLIVKSGYILIEDEYKLININGAIVKIVGVTTGGRHPDITHGNIDSALAKSPGTSFTILLAHDPNQWLEDVAGKRDIDLTLSGHTHGMQMGIMTKKVKWSPSKYFYPNWNGLYQDGTSFQYVNRGLGVLAIPFRIWMPPEITLITLNGTITE